MLFILGSVFTVPICLDASDSEPKPLGPTGSRCPQQNSDHHGLTEWAGWDAFDSQLEVCSRNIYA